MRGLQFKYLFYGCFAESGEMFQAALIIFLLIPCSLSVDYRRGPLIRNETLIWVWNVPTEDCIGEFNHSIDLSLFPLIGSPRKTATGQLVTRFYADTLGLYPHIDTKQAERHGGIPQLANLQSHISQLGKDVKSYIPTDRFGLAVIDWEEWNPIWERNTKAKDIYRNKSIAFVQSKNAGISLEDATRKAKDEFEVAVRRFMESSLKVASALRPKHLWGFYPLPDCYNNEFQDPKYDGKCPPEEKQRNDRLGIIWYDSTGLYPSVYLKRDLKSNRKAALYARYRVVESIRVSKVRNAKNPVPIFVYIRLVFTDNISEFLREADLVNTIGEIVALGPAGIIIWDDMTLAQRAQGCPILYQYMKTTLNPYIINVTLASKMCSQTLCQGKGVCSKKNESSDDYLHLDARHFNIILMENGKYKIDGRPRAGDLKYFSERFQCSCFTNKKCMQRSGIESVENVNVCTGDNVCINARVEPDLAPCLLPGKGILLLTVLTHVLHHLLEDNLAFLGKMLVGAP